MHSQTSTPDHTSVEPSTICCPDTSRVGTTVATYSTVSEITGKGEALESEQVPVLVFGSSLTGLGVIRSFGRAAIPTYSICPSTELMVRSKWYQRMNEMNGHSPTPAGLAAFLSSLKLPRAVLMPCSDDWVEAVAQLPDDLKDRFPSSSASSQVMEIMVDKWRFAEMLRSVGVPHPPTALLSTMEEMEDLPECSYENTFLKPRGSLDFGKRHGVKAFLINDKEDALKVMRKGESAGHSDFPIMLQEYIPGPPTNHYFVDGFVNSAGKVCALFARQRLRMYPPLLGNSTLMETVPLQQVSGAIDTIQKIAAATRYRGIFSAEFKFDDRDGLFKILEVNARPWWYIEFAVRSGVDVCMMAYRDALGLSVEQVTEYEIGKRCVYVPNEIKAYRQNPNREGLVRWLSSWVFADKTVFCWDDVGPAFASMSKHVKSHFQKKA